MRTVLRAKPLRNTLVILIILLSNALMSACKTLESQLLESNKQAQQETKSQQTPVKEQTSIIDLTENIEPLEKPEQNYSNYSNNTALLIQTKLTDLGIFKWRIDGIWGDRSRAAMRKFQNSQGIKVTGELNDETLALLGYQYVSNNQITEIQTESPAPKKEETPDTSIKTEPRTQYIALPDIEIYSP